MKAFSCTSTRLHTESPVPVARSSHGISVAGDAAYLFGGENVARTPIDSTLYRLDLAAPGAAWAAVECDGDVPPPRVAHTQAVVPQADGSVHLYIFGGRVGITMDEKPLNDLYRAVLSPNGKVGTWEVCCPALPCLDLPCPALPCPVLACYALPCHALCSPAILSTHGHENVALLLGAVEEDAPPPPIPPPTHPHTHTLSLSLCVCVCLCGWMVGKHGASMDLEV